MPKQIIRHIALTIGVATALSGGLMGQSSPPRPDAMSLVGTDTIKAFIASRAQKNWTPPTTPWGDPDISGVFTTKDEANTPFERPDEWAGRKMDDITPKEFAEAIVKRQQRAVEQAPFAGGGEPEEGVAIAVPIHWFDNLAAKNSRPWFVIDPPEGRVPSVTPEGDRQVKEVRQQRAVRAGEATNRGGRRDTYMDRSIGDRCILVGGHWMLPAIYGNSFQVLQTKDYVVIRQEMVHEARLVPIEGRRSTQLAPVRSYGGSVRGRWDGNSFLVETTNFRADIPYRDASTRDLRMVERFTRIAPNKVERTVTIDNPTVYPRPWTYSLPMTVDDGQLIHEYACHEGNFGMANLLSAGREADQGRAPK